MISHQATRLYFGFGKDCPSGYTMCHDIRRCVGISSEDIHLHLGPGWEQFVPLDELNAAMVNLAINPRPPLITMGPWSPDLAKLAWTRRVWS